MPGLFSKPTSFSLQGGRLRHHSRGMLKNMPVKSKNLAKIAQNFDKRLAKSRRETDYSQLVACLFVVSLTKIRPKKAKNSVKIPTFLTADGTTFKTFFANGQNPQNFDYFSSWIPTLTSGRRGGRGSRRAGGRRSPWPSTGAPSELLKHCIVWQINVVIAILCD